MTVTGFGNTDPSSSVIYHTGGRKLYAKVVDPPNDHCGAVQFSKEREFCYGAPPGEGVVCKFDDGDPIFLPHEIPDFESGMLQWHQVGIQSRGHEKCDAQYTVATRLSAHVDWIVSTLLALR